MHDPIAERWETQNEAGRRFFGKGDLARAEQAFTAAIREAEQLGAGDLRLATSLANLAQLKLRQRDYDEAQRLFQRSLRIREVTLGLDHASLVQTINGLAAVHYARGETDAAEPLFQRALSITERRLGPQHPDIVTSLNSLARIAFKRSDYAAAGPLLERLLLVKESTLGPEHPEAAPILTSLVKVRLAEHRIDEAEHLARRVVAIRESEQPRGDLTIASSLESLADVLAQAGKRDEEAAARQRAAALRTHPAATAGLLPLTKRSTPDESLTANATPPQPKASVVPPVRIEHDAFALYLPEDETPRRSRTPVGSAMTAPSPISSMPRIPMDAPGDLVIPHRKTPPAAPPPMRVSPPSVANTGLTVGAGSDIVPMPMPPAPVAPVAPHRDASPPPRPPRRPSVEKPMRREHEEARRESTPPRAKRKRSGRKVFFGMMLVATTGVAAATIGRGGVIESRGVAGDPPRVFVAPPQPAVSSPAPVLDQRALDSIAAVVRDSVAMMIGQPAASPTPDDRGAATSATRNDRASATDPRPVDVDAPLPSVDLRGVSVDVGSGAAANAARVRARIDSATRKTVAPTFQSKSPGPPQP